MVIDVEEFNFGDDIIVITKCVYNNINESISIEIK